MIHKLPETKVDLEIEVTVRAVDSPEEWLEEAGRPLFKFSMLLCSKCKVLEIINRLK